MSQCQRKSQFIARMIPECRLWIPIEAVSARDVFIQAVARSQTVHLIDWSNWTLFERAAREKGAICDSCNKKRTLSPKLKKKSKRKKIIHYPKNAMSELLLVNNRKAVNTAINWLSFKSWYYGSCNVKRTNHPLYKILSNSRRFAHISVNLCRLWHHLNVEAVKDEFWQETMDRETGSVLL